MFQSPDLPKQTTLVSPVHPPVGSYDRVYSAKVGDLSALQPFLCPFVTGVLGGAIGAFAYGLKNAGYSLFGARSEQGAGFRALGFAKETGFPALVITVGGAPAAALAQPLWCSMVQRAPIVAITGEVETALAGNGAVQDGTGSDGPSITDLLSAVTCRSKTVHSVAEAWRELLVCVGLSLAGLGNTHLSIPSDIQRRLFVGGTP
jgi:acetolactate synthase-1/2/3 large subunit